MMKAMESKKKMLLGLCVYVDTGQFYYANTATGIQQWNNPFNDDIELDDEREQTEQDIEAAIECLLLGMTFWISRHTAESCTG